MTKTQRIGEPNRRSSDFMSRLRVPCGRIGLITLVAFVAACLPVIPVLVAPVVPEPSYRSALVCVVQLVWSAFQVGMHVQATSLTWPAFMGLIITAFVVGRRLDRKFFAAH